MLYNMLAEALCQNCPTQLPSDGNAEDLLVMMAAMSAKRGRDSTMRGQWQILTLPGWASRAWPGGVGTCMTQFPSRTLCCSMLLVTACLVFQQKLDAQAALCLRQSSILVLT